MFDDDCVMVIECELIVVVGVGMVWLLVEVVCDGGVVLLDVVICVVGEVI